MMDPNLHVVHSSLQTVPGDDPYAGKEPIEGYKLARDGDPGFSVTADLKDDLQILRHNLSLGWVKAAAKEYNISPNLEDMVILPAPAMYAELPNKNTHAFPLAELIKFNTTAGRVVYETWVGRPVLLEHNFTTFDQSKGVILATSLRPVRGFAGKLHRLDFLKAFCREKDPQLAAQVQNGERRTISMGATCTHFACSICGGIVDRNECNHVTKGSLAMPLFEVDGLPLPKIGYNECITVCGQESSSVGVPAYPYATGFDPMTLVPGLRR